MQLSTEQTLSELIADLYSYPNEVTVDLENCGPHNVRLVFPNGYIISIGVGPHHYGNNRDDFVQNPSDISAFSAMFDVMAFYDDVLDNRGSIDRAAYINNAYEFEVGILYNDSLVTVFEDWGDKVKGWVTVPELVDIIEHIRNLNTEF